MNLLKRAATALLAGSMVIGLAACGQSPAPATAPEGGSSTAASPDAAASEDPIKISLYYSDNATLPFREDWRVVQEIQKRNNVELKFEVIPIADYQTKVSLALNTGDNVPDVILYQSTSGENASLALNGAMIPISDYADWTPNFNSIAKEFGMEADLENLNLKDGKRYFMPAMFDKPFYDGGLILREDFLKTKGLAAPKTFDDLYNILKAYKEENPQSYPLTILSGPRVLYRMMMPSYGISLGKNGAGGSYVLSYDYEKNTFFEGATSDLAKQYFTYLAKLFSEGLLDPEMADPIDGDKWNQKLATGASMATYAYYDQIGGVEGSTEIEGLKLNMYPPLEGPGGAHHQQKNRTGSGIIFPKKTGERKDFEQVVRAVDQIFFSEENAKLWCLGVEGESYTMDGDTIVYSDEIKNSPDGIYKSMQLKYGCGSDVTQMVWINSREMTKYDENYANINATVAAMPDSIQAIPPVPMFDDLTAEDAGSLQTPLLDTFTVWSDSFITGKKSLETDWDAYVKEMNDLNIGEFCKLYNDNLKK